MNRTRLFSCVLVPALVSIPTFAQDADESGLEDLFFDSDGVKIRYVEQGEGEPLVLIHGFTGNIEMMWQLPGIMDELAKDYRVIALDCRGHGKSDKPHETEAYGAKMVDDVIGLMDHLKIEKAHLLGYSMGGMIAFRMVVDHPERIISALPCGYGWAPPGVGENDFMDRLADSLEKEGSIRPLLEVLTPNGAEMDEEQFKQVDQMIRLMNDTKALAAVARTMEDLRPDEEKLKANEIPTLTIIGGADPLHFPARSMLARMSNFEVKAIPRTDHMTAFSDPEFLKSVREFLAKHAAADRYFDSDGIKIRYVEQGEGEPLVLIHGFCANLDNMWLLPGIVDAMAKEYRVIALDCRGHGKSDKPHEPEKYGDEMAADVVRLLGHLKIEKAHLMGYSMGGMITLKVMTDHPDRVLSALPCGFGWGPKSDIDDQRREELAVALEERGSIRPLMEFLAGENGMLNEEQLEQTDQMLRMMNDTKALAAVVRGFKHLRPDDEKLKANKVPALAIVGTNDPFHFGVQYMDEQMSNLEIRLIDGGDHMSTIGDMTFFEAVHEFLKQHTKAAAK